jgi:hypothetical protein
MSATFAKSAIMQAALVAAVTTGALAAASAAPADVVCNRSNECWHVRDRLNYPAGVGIAFHDDAWGLAHRNGRWRWRDGRVGRRYVRSAVWIAF